MLKKLTPLIRHLAKKVGWVTTYHITYRYTTKWGRERHVSYTMQVTPWLHVDDFYELNDAIKAEAVDSLDMPVLCSVTRL